VEEELGFCAVSWRVAEDGDVGIWVEAVDETSARRSLDAEAAGADGDPTVGLDFDGGSLTEDVGPPRAFGWRAERGAAFLLGGLPGGERGHGQFAMAFVGVAVEAVVGEQGMGGGDGADGLGGAECREAVLPILMAALDFAFGLRGGGVAEGDAVEVERGAELGESVGDAGEKEAVAIDVEPQRQAVGEEGAREEVEVGEERFGGVDLRAELRRLQSSSMLSSGSGEPSGHQRCGVASSCQSAPILAHCQRRTGALALRAGLAGASP